MQKSTNTIEIITHCYSPVEVPIYHWLMKMQMRSLLGVSRNTIKIIFTAIMMEGDELSLGVFTEMQALLELEGIQCKKMMLQKAGFFRRAIGRNQAALATCADVVWFADADYLFMYDSLERAVEQSLTAHADLTWPGMVHIHQQHQFGDALIDRWEAGEQPEVDLSEFSPRRERRAIGGMQVVNGKYCRSSGYLKDTNWLKPDEKIGRVYCGSDVAFRRQLKQVLIAGDIPGIYRIRHSTAGRDFGKRDHGAKTRV